MSITGITKPEGFQAAATTAGIKVSGKPDMALVVNTGPTKVAACVTTRNQVVAAPVVHTRTAVQDGSLDAIVLNSGNALACIGEQGTGTVKDTVAAVADALSTTSEQVAMCSTGIIGEPLGSEKFVAAVEALVDGLGPNGNRAAQAILTTDLCRKQTAIELGGFTVGGMAKGAGMIAPSLATMLCVLTTDADVDHETAQRALAKASEVTFNRLDIDGSCSTNDTAILMCSGASGVTPTALDFEKAVLLACEDLARQLQADAEGVTKRVAITVTGAKNDDEALIAARTVGRDTLTKCALFGSDPNWGRVLAAVGIAPITMDPANIAVFFNDQAVCLKSCGTPDARTVDLTGEDIDVRIDLGNVGPGTATVYTTDLSHDYVEINSAYST